MAYKIFANSSLQKRAIRIGLHSQGLDQKNSVNAVVGTDLQLLRKLADARSDGDRPLVVFAFLDAIPFSDYCCPEAAEQLHNLVDMLMFVGDLGNTALLATQALGVTCKPLYNQEETGETAQRIASLNFISRARFGYYPSSLYTIKDLVKNNGGKCFPSLGMPPRLIFAGQDGSHTFMNVFRRATGNASLLESAEDILRQGKQLSHDSIEGVCEGFHEIYSASRELLTKASKACPWPWTIKHLEFVLFRSIQRLLLLRFLADSALLLCVKYPEAYVNVYMRRYFSRFLHLDLGGAGGLEKYYPRVVDGLITGHTFLALNPDLARDSFLQYDIRPDILDHSLHDLYERVLLAVNHSSVVE